MKILKYLLFFPFLLFGLRVFGAEPDTFLVDVIPSTFDAGEAVDLRVTAVGSDGETVTNYLGDIFITANVFDGTQYTVPNDGIYTFLEEDQGSKLFSKGLVINEAGEFDIVVEDILGLVSGSTGVVVESTGGGGTGQDNQASDVTVVSPAPGTILQSTGSINIIGESSSPNTPVRVGLNGTDQDTEATTDASGNFNVYADGLVEGDNTLIVKLKNIAGEVLGQSSQVIVTLSPDQEEETLQSFFVQPQSDIYVGDLFTVGVITSDAVTSVEVTIGANKFPMDKFGVGQFGKEISLQFPGTYAVQVHTYIDGQKNSFPQDPLKILEEIEDNEPDSNTGDTTDPIDDNVNPSPEEDEVVGIGQIGHKLDAMNRGTVNVFWEPIGDMEYFVVRHGTSPAYLDKEIVVVDTGIELTGLQPGSTVYVQVRPADADGNTIGVPSDALSIDVDDMAPECVVKGITIGTEKKGDRYYLVWDEVPNAIEYVVYRSDFAVSLLTEMQEIGRTDLPTYPYPFNPNAENYEYAYYAVEALCDGGGSAPIDEIKKVQVGPTTNMIAIMIVATLLYFLYRINYYRRFDD